MFKNKSVIRIILLSSIIILSMTVFFHTSFSKETEKRVLFISSYSASFPSIPEQIDGIRSVFHPNHILFDIEFMDTKRLYTEETFENFYTSISYKLNALERYDAVLVGDDNALQFVMDYQEELFLDIPIIFFAVNSLERAEEASADEMISGVVEALSIKETIDTAIGIHPMARTILAITDNTETGQTAQGIFQSLQSSYPDRVFEVINSEDYSYDEVGQLLGDLDNDTILVYLAMFQDKDGRSNSINDSARMLYDMSPIPVYLPYSNGVGEGFFGGKVVYHYEQGRLAAELAMKVLNGQSIEDFELISESPNQYLFDYELVEFYDIDKRLLPEATIFVNEDISFYRMNYVLIWTFIAIISVLVLGIFILLVNIIRRKESEANLMASNTELKSVTEELISQEEELINQYDDLRESEKALRISQDRYELVFEASAEGLWDYDYGADKTYMSGEWHNDYIDIKEMTYWHEAILEEDKPYYDRVIEDVISSKKKTYACDYRVKDKASNIKWIHEKGISSFNAKGQISRIVGGHVDITHRKEQDERIKDLAYMDSLTGLPNRVSLYDDAELRIRYFDKPSLTGAIIFLDIDNFKYVNDTYGHSIGDEVLKEIGSRVSEIVSSNVYVYRLGGDEFVINIDGLDDSAHVSDLVAQVQRLISEPFLVYNYTFNLTTSIGIAFYPEDGLTIEDLLKNADTAMFKAKEAGRNRHKNFEHTMNQEIYERMLIQNNIRVALEKDEFTLYYQPIVDTLTDKICGYEALIRWFSEENGYIPPNQFIGVAEQMGVIVQIGEWVFETACKFSKTINSGLDEPLMISVNVSAVQLMQKEFVEQFIKIAKRTDVTMASIGLEITETALMESFVENRAKLVELQANGFKIYLDDFGTGYSSLNYLRELPINTIKIDKSFIDDVANGDATTNLTEDIIQIAHKVGLDVVAEGVEEAIQLDKLRAMDCDKIQGYLFSKPLPEEEARGLYSKDDESV